MGPSAGNSQPWAFIVGRRDDVVHQRLVPLLRPSVRRWAPAASAVLMTLHRVASGPEDDAPLYSDYALHDLGQAVAHLTVQASALGLATHQFAALDHDGVTAAFDVPAHWRVTAGIAVGKATASETWPRERRAIDEIAFGVGLGRDLPVASPAVSRASGRPARA